MDRQFEGIAEANSGQRLQGPARPKVRELKGRGLGATETANALGNGRRLERRRP